MFSLGLTGRDNYICICVWAFLALSTLVDDVTAPTPTCPGDSYTLHRLGKTKYYILQPGKTDKKGDYKRMYVTWKRGKELCEKLKLKLAKIPDIQTEVHVSRALEKFLWPLEWEENYYWIDAMFDQKTRQYHWQDTKEPLSYVNMWFNGKRPKGMGDLFTASGSPQTDPKKRYKHCLALALPLMLNGYYGMQTAFYERHCDYKVKSNVLCEADPACELEIDNSVFTKNGTLYYDGMWPMSNRRFVVSWTPRNFQEAKALCESHKMQLYEPHQEDGCLIPHLKNWMRRVTTYSFWTGGHYDVMKHTYHHANGSIVSKFSRNMTFDYTKLTTRSEGDETDFVKTCTSMTWNNEVQPDNVNFCNCSYNSIVLSGENCRDKIGTICQHPHFNDIPCSEEYLSFQVDPGEYTPVDAAKFANRKFHEYYNFNEDSTAKYKRSAYKQTGDHGPCPKGYRRISERLKYWGTVEEFKSSKYPYDYLSPYWLRSKKDPNDDKKHICQVSEVSYDAGKNELVRKLTTMSCDEWAGFVICRKKCKKPN